MLKRSSKFASKYLPFDNFHIAEITGIGPDFLRGSARRLAKDREEIKHTTVLNHICKSLGFRGGFSGYKSQANEIQDFIEKQGLKHEGLYAPDVLDRPINIDLGKISDRCFQSSKACAVRIFTGAGVDWFDLLTAALRLPDFVVVNQFTGKIIDQWSEIEHARGDAPAQWAVRHEEKILSYHVCMALNTLIGDHLVQFAANADVVKSSNVAKIYFPQTMTQEEIALERQKYLCAADILSGIITSIDQGWVEILPYSEKLIFLRDWTGSYDFICPHFRQATFDHNIHLPYLKNADVPKSDHSYHFKRWCYFNYEGWWEMDEHAAEQEFYSQGGQARDYPGEEEILRAYLSAKGRYVAPSKTAPLTDGFKKVVFGNKCLAVSDLISIKRFRYFMEHENELYAKYRPQPAEQDDWRQCNQLDDIGTAPASVTWYDASAFAATVSKVKKLPVRLPTEEEWLAITMEFRGTLRADAERFPSSNQSRIVEKGERSADHGFFGTRYNCGEEDIPWERTKDGIAFLRSIDFGEWLLPIGAVVNSRHLGAMNIAPLHFDLGQGAPNPKECDASVRWENRVSAERDRMSPSSTGAYKGMRIGFRLVYELE